MTPTTNPSTPKCPKCGDSSIISVVVGSDDPNVIGARMENRPCPDCLEENLQKIAKQIANPYDSPDGRTPVDHYMRGGIECIDAMKAISTPEEFQAFCRLTAFKYLWRLGEKDDPAKENKKAQDYLNWLALSLAENPKKK